MTDHQGIAARRWAALSKEERLALPPEERTAILAEMKAHQAQREAINAARVERKAQQVEAAALSIVQTLAVLRSDQTERRTLFAKWSRGVNT